MAPYGKKVRGLAKCRYAPVYNSYFDNGLELEFAETLDQDPSVKEWIKNGRNGSEHFAVPVGPDSLFYPDWLVVYADGTLGIYDTKAHGKGGQRCYLRCGRKERRSAGLPEQTPQGGA